MTDTFKHFDVESLKPSPTNPRKQLGDLTDLTASVKSKGIIEPLVVRTNAAPNSFEIVCGWRRWSAAKAAGLAKVPAVLRSLTDDEVLDIQLAENMERADLTPFEEAQAFQLRLERGQKIGHIGDRIGRSAAYVAQRVKLLTLSPKCRKALEDGYLTLGAALLVARLPDAKLQEEALTLIGGNEFEPCMRASEAATEIEAKLMMRLDKAPFDVTDAGLVLRAGACAGCPKRTGNQAELFADVKSPDLCTDPACFRQKLDAVFRIKAKSAKVDGIEVLTAKDAETIGTHGSAGFMPLGEKVWTDNRYVTVKQLFGKDEPPVKLAQDPKSRMPLKVVPRADVDRAIKRFEAAHRKSGSKGEPGGRSSAQSAEDRKRRIRRAAIDRVLELAVDKAPKLEASTVLEYVTRAYAARAWNEIQKAILRQRGVEVPKGSNVEKTIVKLATLLTHDELRGFALELALRSAAPGSYGAPDAIWKDGLALLKLDFAKIEREVAAEKKAVTKPKPAKPKAKAKAGNAKPPKITKPELAGDGICRDCGCSDLDPCPGGCAWVEPDLCSACAEASPTRTGTRPPKPKTRARS